MNEQKEIDRSQPTIDLNNPPPGQKWAIGLEEEEHPADRKMRIVREVLLFVVALGVVGMICVYAWETLHSATASPDAQKWAFATLTALGSAVVTYLFKK
jgi:cytochrome c-type biogenesis protein CcmH/NrfG